MVALGNVEFDISGAMFWFAPPDLLLILPYSALGSRGTDLRDYIHSLPCPLAFVGVWPVGSQAGDRKEGEE